MNEQYFFLIFLTTILITRIVLYIKPVSSPTIKGFRIHHWMYGVLFISISFLVKNVPLFAIGLGLFIDELSYIIIGGKNHKDNYSFKSLFGTTLFILVVYLLQEWIIKFLISI